MKPTTLTIALILFAGHGFAQPAAGTKTAGRPAKIAAGDWVPIKLHRDRYSFVRGKVNGKWTDILIDTGATRTVLSKKFARKQKLRARRSARVTGVTGTEPAGLTRKKVQIALAGLQFSLRVLVVDLRDVTKALRHDIPVIFGMDAMRHAVIDLDFPNKRMALHVPDNYHYDGKGTTLTLVQSRDRRPRIMLQIEDYPKTRFLIDTGAGGSLHCRSAWTRKHQVLEDRKQVTTTLVGGIGGFQTGRAASFEQVGIGPYLFKDVPANFAARPATAGRKRDGLIGAGLLHRFRMILDSGRRQLHLEPRKGYDKDPFRRSLHGLAALPDKGNLVVMLVARGSPAETSGMKKGDIIVAVDGKKQMAEMMKRLHHSNHRPGSVLTVEDSQGQERKIRLERFY